MYNSTTASTSPKAVETEIEKPFHIAPTIIVVGDDPDEDDILSNTRPAA